MDNFYREIILDHYKNPRNFGRLKNPSSSFTKNNPFCGDEIGMDVKLKIKNEKLKIIEDVKFHGEGCAISMACASILTETVIGKKTDEVMKMKVEDVLDLLKIELTPTRLKCALLPLEVLQKTIYLM